MKTNFLIITAFFLSIISFSQTKSEVIFVDGVCGMCEKRIESNCLATKGIKLADWDKKNRMLRVIYNEKKISLEKIHKKIASIGHDTKLEVATDEAYGKLDMCCKYRDEEVVKNHK
jgi:cation transport ATPase